MKPRSVLSRSPDPEESLPLMTWEARMLGALAYFEEHRGSFRSEFSTPKGAGSATVYHLESYGLLERRGRSLRITPAGTSILKDGSALRTITEIRDARRAEHVEWTMRSISRISAALRAPPALLDDPVPVLSEGARPLVTEEQILAVYKAAKQAGIHVEVRIEGGVVRFVPCSAPQPEPSARPTPKGYF